jgi:hypothetical protein
MACMTLAAHAAPLAARASLGAFRTTAPARAPTSAGRARRAVAVSAAISIGALEQEPLAPLKWCVASGAGQRAQPAFRHEGDLTS